MSDNDLIKAAIDARSLAYAPYSKFDVGAAILDENGAIHTGQNIENAAYPNGICAETAAIAAMIRAGAKKITKIAVAGGDGNLLCTPCGGCRQRIREFAAPDTPILICDDKGLQREFTLAALLPESFGPDNLS
ncbi:cytidine deaminase [Alphaproteobacteria bacterium]|jgi:cytidine deaminase|nr:cytidine deaminase [Alphaproteobacteria bacterium]